MVLLVNFVAFCLHLTHAKYCHLKNSFFSIFVTSFLLFWTFYDVTSCDLCVYDITSCVSGFMCVTFGYTVLVYLKEAMAKDGLIGGSSQEYKLEINPGDSFGLNPVVSKIQRVEEGSTR